MEKIEEFSNCPYFVEMPCKGEIVQYRVIRMEEKRDGVINKMLVPKFDKLKLKRGMTKDGEEVCNTKRLKVGESSKVLLLGQMQENDEMCKTVFE